MRNIAIMYRIGPPTPCISTDSNGADGPLANRSAISKSQLGEMISDGTYYISCWMTMAQVEMLRTTKVMFEDLE